MYSWDEIKRAVERNEGAQAAQALAQSETSEGYMVRGNYIVQRARPYLIVLGGLVVGLHASLLTLGFNYLVFVWVLHVNFDR